MISFFNYFSRARSITKIQLPVITQVVDNVRYTTAGSTMLSGHFLEYPMYNLLFRTARGNYFTLNENNNIFPCSRDMAIGRFQFDEEKLFSLEDVFPDVVITDG